jgi:glycosyltransferase involved in cell wall biosynthesis
MIHNFTLKRGGAERLLFTLSNLLQNRGYEVDIYVLEDDPVECFPELRACLNVKAVSRGFRNRIIRSADTFIPLTAAARIVSTIQGRYDVIHAHNFPANIAAFLATKSRLRGVPFIWGCNEPYRLMYDRAEQYRFKNYGLASASDRFMRLALTKLLETSSVLDRYATKSAHAVTVLSEFTANQIETIYGVKPIVIHPGVENLTARANGQLVRDKFRIGTSPLVLTVSRLWPAKDVATGLRAFSIFAQKVPNAFYMIVGDGPILDDLVAFSRQIGIEKRCLFIGDREVAEIGGLSHFYAACDAFLFTAIDEPWGFVPLEAMCFAKPVVISASGGPMEYIQHHVTGMMAKPSNPNSFAAELLEVFQYPQVAAEMGKKASKLASTYSWEKMTNAYEQLYFGAVT